MTKLNFAVALVLAFFLHSQTLHAFAESESVYKEDQTNGDGTDLNNARSGTDLGNGQQGTDLGNGREGTDLRNGGDGIAVFKEIGSEVIDTVYTYDLAILGIYNIDAYRFASPNYYKKSSLRQRIREVLAKSLAPSDWPQSRSFRDTPCYENKNGFCNPKLKPYKKDQAPRSLYVAIADALAFHLASIDKVEPYLIEKIINKLNQLKFKPVAALPPHDDTREQIQEENRALKKIGRERIGCATRTSDNIVEISALCLGLKMPLSHSAALITHEALYALLIDAGLKPNPDTSGQVRHVVADIFQSADPSARLNEDLLHKFVDKIDGGSAK